MTADVLPFKKRTANRLGRVLEASRQTQCYTCLCGNQEFVLLATGDVWCQACNTLSRNLRVLTTP